MQHRIVIQPVQHRRLRAGHELEQAVRADAELGLALHRDAYLSARDGAVARPARVRLQLERVARPEGLHLEVYVRADPHRLIRLQVGLGEGHVWKQARARVSSVAGTVTVASERGNAGVDLLLIRSVPAVRMWPGATSQSSISSRSSGSTLPSSMNDAAEVGTLDGPPVLAVLLSTTPPEPGVLLSSLGCTDNVTIFLLGSASSTRLAERRVSSFSTSIPESESRRRLLASAPAPAVWSRGVGGPALVWELLLILACQFDLRLQLSLAWMK